MGWRFPCDEAYAQLHKTDKIISGGNVPEPDLQEIFFFPELCDKIFCKDGYASVLPNFEHRPEQQKMAYCCAQAFSSDMPILFEAGTGVGKSLAYLVPGIISAVRFNRQLIVATNTIALQEQIVEKDLPRIKMMFSNCEALNDCADFKYSILVGRANYLCPNRLRRALAEKKELFDTEESRELDRIAEWAIYTKTGLVSELNPPPNPEVWDWVNADSSTCTSKSCADGSCFYQNARRKASSADIVILNHSLLFTLLSAGLGAESGSRGVLFPNDMLVLDEAHLVPNVASDAFGELLSNTGIIRELKRIYDPKKRRGLITRDGMAEHYDRQMVIDTIAMCEEFFAKIKKEFLITRETVRLSVPNWIDDEFPRKLEALASLLEAFAMNAKTDKLAAEIRDYKRIIVGYKNTLEDCIFLGNNEDYVYWVERTGKENRGVAIRSAPLKIAPILRRELFSKNTSVIMTSATLAISNDMESFVSKVGAEDAETFICDSPFNYNANMRAFIATDAPDIEKESRRLDADYISRVCKKLCESIRGGTLILFTSFADLYKTADYLEEHLPARKIIVQGRLSKSQAMREFSENGSAILLGTDTFWTGIDMPGEKLSQVIVARLPFENPSHPLAQARADRVLAEGGKPFQEITIPSAVIKFRQGIGRLIRSKTDKGIVVVLDSRIVSKAYGKNFVDAIPTSRTERFSEDEIDSLIADSIEELGLAPKKNRKLD